MKPKGSLPFDPKVFLSKVNGGRTKSEYRTDQIVYRQAILLIPFSSFRAARSKSLSFPNRGRKPSSPSGGRMNSAAKVA
jgi:hypothetical protein